MRAQPRDLVKARSPGHSEHRRTDRRHSSRKFAGASNPSRASLERWREMPKGPWLPGRCRGPFRLTAFVLLNFLRDAVLACVPDGDGARAFRAGAAGGVVVDGVRLEVEDEGVDDG